MKACQKCGVAKELDQFSLHRGRSDGHQGYCKTCSAANHRAWRLANPEREAAMTRAWRLANPERVAATIRAWRLANPERVAATTRAWRLANPERVAATTRAWRLANPERFAAITRAWRLANPERFAANQRAWRLANPDKVAANRQRYPEKHIARITLNQAVKRGQLTRPLACSHCQRVGGTHGHHEDYTKPFEVIWLCRKCHGAIHRKHTRTSNETQG